MANPIFHSQYTAAQIENLIAHGVPIIQNGNWWAWDITTGAYVDTGLSAEGAQAFHGLADDFDDTANYAVGDLVIYDGEFYVCTTAHTGAWDAADFTATTVAAQIQPLKAEALNAYPHDTASGSVASFSDGADGIPVRSLIAQINPVQAGSGDPSPTNVRPISGWTGANIVVSPTLDAQDGTTYPITFPAAAGTVYGGTLTDNGDGTWTLTVTWAGVDLAALTWTEDAEHGTFSSANLRTGSAYKYIQPLITTISASSVAMVEKYSPISLNDMTASYPDDSFAITSTGNIIVKANASPSGFLAYQIKNGQPLPEYTLTAESVRTLLGTNNIFCDTGEVSVDYRADTTLYIAKKLAEL